MKNPLFTIAINATLLLFLIVIEGCNFSDSCSGGMCSKKGTEYTETEVRQKASVFAYKRLTIRQQSGAAIQGPDMKPLKPEPIDPNSWHVTRSDTKWRLKRHLTRDWWQIVESNLDGSGADCFIEIGPKPEP